MRSDNLTVLYDVKVSSDETVIVETSLTTDHLSDCVHVCFFAVNFFCFCFFFLALPSRQRPNARHVVRSSTGSSTGGWRYHVSYADFQLPLTKLPAKWITRHHDSRSRKFLQHNHRPLLLKTLNNITVKISESYIMMSILLPDEVSTKIHILSTRTVFLLCILTIISRPSSSF